MLQLASLRSEERKVPEDICSCDCHGIMHVYQVSPPVSKFEELKKVKWKHVIVKFHLPLESLRSEEVN